ncbi:MAG: efflux RND transporter periplasmic adaptor subunit [Bacteroidales bacterium]|nr:efflux RND transporter periplasmic adaptor subunit [Bacteroidales bacterium]
MKRFIQAALCMAVVLLGSCTSGQEKEATASVNAGKPKVKVTSVLSRPVPQTQEYTATVEADIKNNIAPASPVRISKIFVEVGDRVKKGEKLVQMDASNLKNLELQLANQESEFNRVNELFKVGGASQSELDASKMALDVKKTTYKNLLENTQLLSPISGIVTARNYDDGDMYSASNPVLTIERITPVKLLVNASEAYFTQVKKGMKVSVKLDVYGDEKFDGIISLVYPTINPNTRTFPVEVKLQNSNMKVRPGMFARVTLDFGSKDRVVVPDQSIIKQVGSGDRYVYVYKDGKVSYNKVQLGQRLGAEYELISGVEHNSQVVIAGQSNLNNGMEVDIEK